MIIDSLSNNIDCNWLWGLHRDYQKEYRESHPMESPQSTSAKFANFLTTYNSKMYEYADKKLLRKTGVAVRETEAGHGGGVWVLELYIDDMDKFLVAKMAR